jgi:hypothetical protein
MYLKFPARNTSLGKENNSVSDLKLDNEKLKIDN